MRIGTGYDSHRLAEGRDLVLGGVHIPFDKGLLGHSDADCLVHAIIDALLGAAALGDIGTYFPDTSEEFRGAKSLLLLSRTAQMLKEHGLVVQNIDSTLVLEKPKIAPYIGSMRENIANALGISYSQVSVKAKTAEGMGFVGRGEGVEAHACALIEEMKK